MMKTLAKKVLTVAVPMYQVQQYIKKCLEHVKDTSRYEERRWGTIKTIDTDEDDGIHSVTKRVKVVAGKEMSRHMHRTHTETITVLSGMG